MPAQKRQIRPKQRSEAWKGSATSWSPYPARSTKNGGQVSTPPWWPSRFLQEGFLHQPPSLLSLKFVV